MLTSENKSDSIPVDNGLVPASLQHGSKKITIIIIDNDTGVLYFAFFLLNLPDCKHDSEQD